VSTKPGELQAINLRYYRDPDELPLITNNTFINNNYGIFADYYDTTLTFDDAVYNSFYENKNNSYFCDLDSTNIFSYPLFFESDDHQLNEDTLIYSLMAESPCIDTGHPDSVYYDLDGSRNDIGLWGGPFGESYDYPTWVREKQTDLPKEFRLFAPYPNPFNQTQTFYFSLPYVGDVQLSLYNILGQKVLTETYQALQAGVHVRTLNATNLSSGVYFLKLTTREEAQQTKIILLK
jgi:hypothetical protein